MTAIASSTHPSAPGLSASRLILDQDALPVGIAHDRLVGGGSRVHDPAAVDPATVEAVVPHSSRQRPGDVKKGRKRSSRESTGQKPNSIISAGSETGP